MTKIGTVLVIGGGIAGIHASLNLADSGFKVYLVEKSPEIGGEIVKLECFACKICNRFFPNEKTYTQVGCGTCELPELIEAVRWNDNIDVLTNSEVKGISGEAGNFNVTILREGKEIELKVGSIILSLGGKVFDANKKPEYGYDVYSNVITGEEFERLVFTSSLNGGGLKRPSDGKEPKRIAFIQCVGSRDEKTNPWCSSVCCLYAIKEAIMAKESNPNLDCVIFYMDIRTFGKELQEYADKAKEVHGIKYIRGRVAKVDELPNKNLRVTYYTEGKKTMEEEFDLVVLSTGIEPPEDAQKLAEVLGIELNKYGFCKTDPLNPLETTRPGIYVCGHFSGPKDIPDSIAQAIGAAAKASSIIVSERGKLVASKEYPPEKNVRGEEPRIGVFVSRCSIDKDVEKITEYAKTLPNVVYADQDMFICSQEANERMKKAIKEYNLNRVVVAGFTPRTYELKLRSILKEAGLNPYLLEVVNIVEQCFSVHEPEKAEQKAKDLIRMAIAKARLLEPLVPREIDMDKRALIIGGGLAGMVAALEIAKQGFECYLIEKEKELGGNLRHIYYLLNGEDPQDFLKNLIKEVNDHPLINVYTNTKVKSVEGYVGNFTTVITQDKEEKELKHGVIIVATGAEEYKPKEYLYGEDDRVMTQVELEEKLVKNEVKPKNVVMIQCVGCRNEERTYCSRICCSVAIKNALKIKEVSPDANIYIINKDIRTYGFAEDYYKKAAEMGVIFITYTDENMPKVVKENGKLRVFIFDEVLSDELIIEPDILVLSAATVPRPENKELAEMLKIPLDKNGFFLEVHTKLRPIDILEGIYLCGMAHSPKSIEESISQACGAAARACTLLTKDKVIIEPIKAFVVDENCDGCAYCVEPCPGKAITLIEYMREGTIKKTVEVNEALCLGCGVCQATCPKRGIFVRGFTLDQIQAMVDAALEVG
ncbi:heterodisulfide reductase [Archaeoglobales archaeon]|nr:MAG: heterodisulfide reductase [Archaeoglobales archaeon]